MLTSILTVLILIPRVYRLELGFSIQAMRDTVDCLAVVLQNIIHRTIDNLTVVVDSTYLAGLVMQW